MTGFLQVVIEQTRPYEAAIDILNPLLEATGHDTVVDLGSGAGGPWPTLFGSATPGTSVILTDLFPNDDAARKLTDKPGLSYRAEPTSALDVPTELHGVRTMFTALHHFEPSEVRDILADAQDSAVPFAAFEATHRSPRGLLVTLLVPILVWVFMPRVKPLRFATLLFTYIVPILPLLIWWDGFASAAKTYTVGELKTMTDSISTPGYEWNSEEIAVPGAPIPLTVLTGRPVAAA